MRIIKILTFGIILSSIFAAACGKNETLKNSSNADAANFIQTDIKRNAKEAVSFSVQKVSVNPGKTAEAVIKLQVAEGFHINANPPSEENLIPTEIKFEASGGISAAKPQYPKGIMKSFAFSAGKQLAVYEGATEIKILLSAAPDAPQGENNLRGKLRIQPCDEEVCYPPKQLDVVIPVIIE